MTAPGSEDGGRRRTRWWMLTFIACVVLAPAAIVAHLVTREPAEPVYVPFAVAADGTAIDLGTLGGEGGMAEDINADGVVVGGIVAADGAYHAFLSRNGTMTDLGAAVYAVAINDAGQVVGTSMDPTSAGWQSFLWTGGAAREVSADAVPLLSARDIDERGWLVGESLTLAPGTYTWPTADVSRTPIAVLWEDGRATPLETAVGGSCRAKR